MNSESKNTQNKGELEYFYIQKKWLIEATAFIGLVAALFLQITHPEFDSLRMLQATLLIIFAFSISYLLITFLIYLIENKPETRIRVVVNGMIVSIFIFVFIFHLFKFLYEAFPKETLFYIKYTRLGVIILISFFFEAIAEFFTKRFGKEKLWIFISEFIWILLLASIWISSKNYFSEMKSVMQIAPSIFLLFVLNLLYAYKILKRKTFLILLFLSGLVWVIISLLFLK